MIIVIMGTVFITALYFLAGMYLVVNAIMSGDIKLTSYQPAMVIKAAYLFALAWPGFMLYLGVKKSFRGFGKSKD